MTSPRTKPKPGALKLPPDRVSNEPAGFADSSAAFERPTLDQQRFSESLVLVRDFGLIDTDAGRQQLLDLARRLAGRTPG